MTKPTSHLSPRLQGKSNVYGRGVFAAEPIQAGDVLGVWGGEVTPAHRFGLLAPAIRQISVQVEEDLFLVPTVEGSAEWFNHSCMPNAGISGQITLVALRPIGVGEEVCYDYAMTDGSPYDEFPCNCGAEACRGRVTGYDWRRPDLWERYGDHFAPYLLRRIEALKSGTVPPVPWFSHQGDGI